ncbi:hypothetical protein D3C80_1521170 [compost metagenome]
MSNEDDVPATYTDVWTWDRLLILLLTIFQAIFPVITYTLDQIETEKNEVIQSEQHDEIIEKFNELIQAIQPLIPEHDSEEHLQVPDNPEQ